MAGERKVRRLKADEWNSVKASIVDIENNSFEEDVRESEEELYLMFREPRSINLILEEDGNILGYAMAIVDPLDETNSYLATIAIRLDNTKRGLGKVLFKAFLEEAIKEGFKRVSLHATNEPIKKVAEKEGFVVKEHIEKFVGTRDAWFMDRNVVTQTDSGKA